ncbi:hypothetical protein C0991_002042 [Blastosporella zonata]|nr:hypothetical protein C0991_002042 [Blastosporella zonata]
MALTATQTIINLAREVDAPSLLPSAFYDLSRYPFSNIFDPSEEDQMFRPLLTAPSALSIADLQKLCLGKEASQQAITALITAMGTSQNARPAQLNPACHSRKLSQSAICVSAAACRKDFSELVDLATQHYLFDRERGCYDPLYVAEELGQLKSAEFSECKACARSLEAWAARERERMWNDFEPAVAEGGWPRMAVDIIPLAAGGGEQCNPVSVTAFSTLLAAPGPCEQQNAADQMIDLAKQLNSDADMIRLTQIFVQQPRNTPSSESVQYCEQAPQNAELNGLFQCQYQGANPTTFVGGVAVGQAGTIPFGMTAPLSPAGSCPAHPSGPIADGSQLIDIVSDPGVSTTGSGTSTSGTATTAAVVAAVATSTPSASSNFQFQNGLDAQALNAQFATLTTSSSCSEGDQACINGGFAQCVSGKYVISSCGSTQQCFALPLVLSAGTTLTCDTEADAIARFAATGVTGGITGNGAVAATTKSQTTTKAAASTKTKAVVAAVATSTVSASSNFQFQNGLDAQALNAQFATLTTSSSCSEGDQACINGGFAQCNGQEAQALNAQFATLTASSACTTGQDACINGAFAQCANGKFVLNSCGADLACAALPLVNSAGTSIACTTPADALARIAATGATGGLTGA